MNVNRDKIADMRDAVQKQLREDGADKITLEFVGAQFEALVLFIEKHNDYGPDNIKDSGKTGVIVRVNDKIKRLHNIHKKQGYFGPEFMDTSHTVKNESIEDTWIDTGNYGLIGLLIHRGLWV